MANAKNIVRQTTEQEQEALHVEVFINNSNNKVTKVSDESVLRGLIRGNVKTSKKALKDITLAISTLYIDLAFGSALDEAAEAYGVAPRFAAAQSSTWVRLRGDAGTFYEAGVNTVSDNKGNVFDLEDDVTIGTKGYAYVKVRSQQSGLFTNAKAQTIINITPEPAGHIGVLNEYAAFGGRDVEDDITFRQRIKEGPDILAHGTLSYITQAFMKINSNVLRVVYDGVSDIGKVVLSILTVNGVDLTDGELDTLLEQGGQYFPLTTLRPIGTQSYGITLQNATYIPIDIDFRGELFAGADLETVVADIQQKFSKLVDFRFWESSLNSIEWEDLLLIVKNTEGIKTISDRYFTPAADIRLNPNEFPRFRGFIFRDLAGTPLLIQADTVDSIFYTNATDVNFAETVL